MFSLVKSVSALSVVQSFRLEKVENQGDLSFAELVA